MINYKLPNGLSVLLQDKQGASVTVQITVKAGSNDEKKKVAGISHFMEHMLFEGTTQRPNARIIAAEIENLGAEFNAFTTNERTSYYIKVPKKHIVKALDILSDMITNSLFQEKNIEKERKIVLKEVDMVMDEPRYYQHVFFEKTLFKKHPAKNPVYGSRNTLAKIKRKDFLDYYKKYYVPSNIVLALAGGLPSNIKKVIAQYFLPLQKAKKPKQQTFPQEPKQTKQLVTVKRDSLSSYTVFGYKTVPRMHQDSYTLDLIYAILGKGQSGWVFDEVRNKRGLAYEVKVVHQSQLSYGYFAINTSIDKKNIQLIQKIYLALFKRLQSLSLKELKAAKTYLEGRYLLDQEDTHEVADELTQWHLVSNAKEAKTYLKKINKITVQDIKRVSKKYLNQQYTMTVLQQK